MDADIGASTKINSAPIIVVSSGVINATKRLSYYEDRRVKKAVRNIMTNGKKRTAGVHAFIANKDDAAIDPAADNNPRAVPELVPDDEPEMSDEESTAVFWNLIEMIGWNEHTNFIRQRNFVQKFTKLQRRVYTLKSMEMFMSLKVRLTPVFTENNLEEYIEMAAAYFIFHGKVAFDNVIDDPTVAMFYIQNEMCTDLRAYIV